MDRENFIQVDFTDTTMAEANGEFEDVKELMQEESYDDTWMIRSTITITSGFGIGMMVLHFFGTGKILIDEYDPSVNDVHYNPDVSSLSQWALDAGWHRPEPGVDLIRHNKEFWKYFWETYLINSSYLDKIYGKRDIFEGEESND